MSDAKKSKARNSDSKKSDVRKFEARKPDVKSFATNLLKISHKKLCEEKLETKKLTRKFQWKKC